MALYDIPNHDAFLFAPLYEQENAEYRWERACERATDELRRDLTAQRELVAEAMADCDLDDEGELSVEAFLAGVPLAEVLLWERAPGSYRYGYRHSDRFPVGFQDHLSALFEREVERRAERAA